jgi:hypothetical protein
MILGVPAILIAASSSISSSTASASDSNAIDSNAVAAMQKSWSFVPEFASSPVLAQGRVVTPSGAPVSGATVILFPVLDGPAAGTRLTPLARASTDASGQFVTRLPASEDELLATKRSAGALNLHVIAFYPGGMAQWFYSIPAQGRASGTLPTARLTLKNAGHATPANASPAAASPDSCEAYGSRGVISGIPVIVGFKQSTDSNLAYAAFSYSSGTSMTLGVGISYDSDFGGFSADGTSTQTSGLQGAWANMTGAGTNNLEGAAVYYNQEYLCYAAQVYTTYWQLTQHQVGGQKGSPGAEPVSVGDCDPTQPGATNTITSGTQETFSAGVQLKGLGYGINLSAQDGWSSDSKLAYKQGSSGHPICGQDDWPGSPDYVGVVGIH